MRNKFWRIRVPTLDSFSSRVLKVCNLSRVEARYLKPKIVFSRSTITSPVRTCSNIARIVKAEFQSPDSNITWVQLLPLIGLDIRTRIIAKYRIFLSSEEWSSYSPKIDTKSRIFFPCWINYFVISVCLSI